MVLGLDGRCKIICANAIRSTLITRNRRLSHLSWLSIPDIVAFPALFSFHEKDDGLGVFFGELDNLQQHNIDVSDLIVPFIARKLSTSSTLKRHVSVQRRAQVSEHWSGDS